VTRGSLEVAVVALVVTGSLAATVGILEGARSDEPRVRAERASLGFGDTSRSCEGCHPRHTAEWRRSVMAHAARSPLFQSLEMLIEEQVGRSTNCPEGAGVLRRRGADECRDAKSGLVVTGSGGEGWCVSCHAPGENLENTLPVSNEVQLGFPS
jgi:eukaryotic-like serine/threonine-protein kinase